MAIEHIGYRRLYDAIECSIIDHKEMHVVFPFGDHLQIEIYMGPKPKFGISIEKNSTHYLTESIEANASFDYQVDAAQSSHPRAFFMEIVCLREVEVSADLSDAFHRQEQKATQEMLRIAESYGDEDRYVADFICGVIGLRFHRQFVIELLNENYVAPRKANFALTVFGSPMEQLERIQMSERGIEQMKQLSLLINKKQEDARVQADGMILGWLMRAWTERDAVSKFNALFIPLEMILRGVKGQIAGERRLHAKTIRELIAGHGGEQKEQLTKFFDALINSQRPSLVGRFEQFAESANMACWQSDVEAFRHFNKIRNDLVHQGQAKVKLMVAVPPVGEDEIRALEDLVERYVNYALFQDTVVYQSHWRAKPHRPMLYRARLMVNT